MWIWDERSVTQSHVCYSIIKTSGVGVFLCHTRTSLTNGGFLCLWLLGPLCFSLCSCISFPFLQMGRNQNAVTVYNLHTIHTVISPKVTYCQHVWLIFLQEVWDEFQRSLHCQEVTPPSNTHQLLPFFTGVFASCHHLTSFALEAPGRNRTVAMLIRGEW